MPKAPVRVRGMNAAALNPGSLSGVPAASGAAAEPRFPHASMRQLLVAVALLAAGCLTAWYTFTEITGGPTSFAGTVEPQQSVGLDFTATGRVTQVFVKPGQKVVKGQRLAAEDLGSAKATLADAQAVLAANRAKVRAMQSPTLSAAARQDLDSQVTDAGTRLSGAQQASSDAIAQATARITGAQQTLTAAKSVRDADTAQYQAACPNGAPRTNGTDASPDPADSAPASAPASAAPDQKCPDQQAQVQRDNATVDSAAANLAQVRTDASQLRDRAASAVTASQQALASAQDRRTVAAAPASAADVSAAQADVATAQRAVDQDKQSLAELTIVSPFDGIVADIGGIVGDLDGSTGVHTLPGPRAVQRDSGPAFSLFPPSSGANSSESTYARQQPLISLVTEQSRAKAQVSEKAVKDLRPGRHARVTVNALNKTVDATVAQVIPIPVDQGGSVNYAVVLTAAHFPPGLLPGMSLSVVFP